jgi:hypothetical protein
LGLSLGGQPTRTEPGLEAIVTAIKEGRSAFQRILTYTSRPGGWLVLSSLLDLGIRRVSGNQWHPYGVTARFDGCCGTPGTIGLSFGEFWIVLSLLTFSIALDAVKHATFMRTVPVSHEIAEKKDLGFQRSPQPEHPDQSALEQPAKIAHRFQTSTDS